MFVCWPSRRSEFEQESNTEPQQGSNTDSHKARNKAQALPVRVETPHLRCINSALPQPSFTTKPFDHKHATVRHNPGVISVSRAGLMSRSLLLVKTKERSSAACSYFLFFCTFFLMSGFLRMRTLCGVTSTSSSSTMYSRLHIQFVFSVGFVVGHLLPDNSHTRTKPVEMPCLYCNTRGPGQAG